MNKIKKEAYFELAVFLMDYHRGKWSRGYRLLGKLNSMRLTDSCIRECRNSEVYCFLVDNYSDTV